MMCSALQNLSVMHVPSALISSELERNDNSILPSSISPQTSIVLFAAAATAVEQDKAIVGEHILERQKRRNTALCPTTLSSPTSRKRASPSPPHFKNLTLSAYRRPEVAVRLTDCAVSKQLTDDYEWCVIHTPSGLKGCVLGRGASSVVRLAARKDDGTKVAAKCIPKHELMQDHRRCGEFRLLQQISHPNIVKLRDVYETSSDLYLVMDLAHGDLYSKIEEMKRFPESATKKIVFKMLEALTYLHDEVHIVHRDVKPENILLFDSDDYTDVKLTDFGLAKKFLPEVVAPQLHHDVQGNRRRAYSRVGSDFYTAPEVSAGCGYDTAVDLYSLGVCTYILLIGSPPCSTIMSSDEALPTLIEASKWRELSVEAKDFIGKLLSFDPIDRPTAAEALRHDWFNADRRTLDIKESLCAVVQLLRYRSKSDVVSNPSAVSAIQGTLASNMYQTPS